MAEEPVWTFVAVDEVTPVTEEITASVKGMLETCVSVL
jgi:hypothetical protein